MTRQTYSFEAWEEELYLAYAEGADPHPCPECGRTGFYGPRFAEPDLRYRSCRFCGFWQSVEGAPALGLPTVHGCETWPHVARAPYLWWVAPSTTSYTCPYCRDEVNVADATVTIPGRDRRHPWWKVPQGRTAKYYRRFWENWAATKGRVFF